MDIGAVSLLFQEKGFDATMAKVAALDAAGARVGAKAVEVRVSSPTAGVVQAALAQVGETATQVSSRPVTLRFALAGLTELSSALGVVEGAKAEAATPVTTTVAPPNVGPAVAAFEGLEAEKAKASTPVTIPVLAPTVGPALAALTALEEAQATIAGRTTALKIALQQAGNEGVALADKAKILQSALADEQAATDRLSAATRQLDIQQRDGIEVIRLRAQALTELREAQNALSREETLASGVRVRAAPLTGGVVNPITVAPQLGPATPEAEAFAQRAAATKAAFEAEAAAARNAAAATGAVVVQTNNVAGAQERLSPKLRTAANGLTAVAFAATASGGSFQSMALGAGLAAQSLASMATGPVALWASGIGAAVVVGVAIIGILDRMAERAANTKTAFAEVNKEIAQFTHVSEAEAELTKQTRKLAEAQAALDAATRNALAGGSAGALSLGADIATIAVLQKVVERGNDLVEAARKKRGALELRDTEQLQAARLGIITRGTAAQNNALEAASQAFLATEQAKFASGRASLDQFFNERLQAIKANGAREVAALRERQALLAEPVAGATAAESAQRAAEIRALGSEIAAVEARTREETTRTTEERRAQREALSKAVIALEQREQDAAGDASEARIAAAKREAVEIARTLVQQSDPKTPQEFAKAYADANARAQQFVTTQTTIIRTQQAQNQAAREFAALGVEREAIQRRLERGEITQAQAEQEIAAAERARIPALIEIAAKMEKFAAELKNPDLLAAAKRLRGEIEGMANTPLGPLAQQVKSVLDQLSVEAAAGDQWAASILKELQADIEKNGGVITIGIAVKAGWLKQIKDEIQTQGALLDIVIKPRNIILSGIAQAIGNLNQQLGSFAANVGNALGTALADGFSSAFTHGSGKSFFEQAGLSILAGVGGLLVQLGSAMLTYGLLMAAGLPLLLATPFAGQALSAPAAIAAGTGLIALGAGMGAIAANNTGTRTGGAGASSGGASRSTQIPTQQVVLDPDRRLREAREVAPKPTVNPTAKAAPAQQPFVFAPTIIGTNDPKAQRDIATLVEGAVRRGLLPARG